MPQTYFEALLLDMPNALPNSVREKRHLRPPVRKKTFVLHYRDYHISDVVAVLEQRSGLMLNLNKSYLGDKEITGCTQEQRQITGCTQEETLLRRPKQRLMDGRQDSKPSTNAAYPNCCWVQ